MITSPPVGHARRHADGVADGAAPGIDRQAHHIHVEQFAELARIFEPRLVAAEIGLRRAPDGGQELGAPDDLIDDGRHMMLPAAGAEEIQIVLAILVLGKNRGEMPPQGSLPT